MRERGRRRRPIRIHVLTLALVALELVAQVFSLPWFPTSGSLGGLYLAARHCVRWGDHVAAGSASNFVRMLPGLGDPFIADSNSQRLEGPRREDGRAEPDDGLRLRVEVIIPNRATLTSPNIVPPPATRLSIIRWTSPPAISGRGTILGRSIPLAFCKLNC